MKQRGGKRPGAGRPAGTLNLPRFSDYVTDEERRKFVEFMLDQYMGDMRLALWFGDHAFAKPLQYVDHTTNGKDLPQPILHAIQHNDSDEKGSVAR